MIEIKTAKKKTDGSSAVGTLGSFETCNTKYEAGFFFRKSARSHARAVDVTGSDANGQSERQLVYIGTYDHLETQPRSAGGAYSEDGDEVMQHSGLNINTSL